MMEDTVFKNGRRRAFKRSEIERLIDAAKSLPKKSEIKDELNVKEMITQLRPALVAMLHKGYSYSDIANWFIEQGVSASESTLETAIGQETRKGGLRRSRRTRIQGTNKDSLDEVPTDNNTVSIKESVTEVKPAAAKVLKKNVDDLKIPVRSSSAFSEEV